MFYSEDKDTCKFEIIDKPSFVYLEGEKFNSKVVISP
jgi:hypothetical protein